MRLRDVIEEMFDAFIDQGAGEGQQGQGQGIAGAGIHADQIALPVQPDHGVKRVFPQFRDHHFVYLRVEPDQHVLDQIVGHGTRRGDLFNLQGDGVSFVNPYPNGQNRVAAVVL